MIKRSIFNSYILVTAMFFCCNQDIILCQESGFTKTYFFDHRSTIFHAVRQMGSDLVILGQLGTDSTGLTGIFIAKMDTMGELLKLVIFQDPLMSNDLNLSYYSCESIEPTFTNGFVVSGSTRFSRNLFFIQLDENLDFVFYREFPSSLKVRYVNDIIALNNAYYTFGIVQTLNLDADIFLQKLSRDGDQIWERTYGIPQYWENAQSGIIEDNGISILASEWYDPNEFMFNDEYSWNNIFHIDTSGEIIWKNKTVKNEEGGGPEGLIKINNKYYYTTHPAFQENSQLIHYAPEIVCRDSSFNLLWKRNYGDTLYLNWFSTLTTGPDSFLYAAGYIPDGVTWGRVCKIDPEDGGLVWDARDTAFYIPGWGSRNRMEGLTVLPSGSVIAVGYTVDYTAHENGLLYKVTKDGCLDTLCTGVGIEEIIKSHGDQVKVYPNPASSEIHFDINYLPGKYFVELFSLTGQLMIRKQLLENNPVLQIDHTAIPTGIYIWKLYSDKRGYLNSGKIFISGT